MKALFKKYADKIKSSTLNERDIIALRSHLNGMRNSFDTCELSDLHDLVDDCTPTITSDQSTKGIAWLRDQWHTPRGKVRKNNPFGYREQQVLESFSHFELVGFHDAGNGYRSNYLPTYRVIATDGATFDYVPYGNPDWPTNKTVYIVA